MTYKVRKEPLEMSVKKFKNTSDLDLIEQSNLEVLDENGQNVTDLIQFDRQLVDLHEFNRAQRLPIYLKADREGHREEIGYLSITLVKKHIFRYILITLLLIVVAGGLSMCHQHSINQQNTTENSQQDQSIARNHQKISRAMQQIDQLDNEVKQLKDAIKQYQQSNDKAAFEQQLTTIQQQVQQLQQNQQVQSDHVGELINKINDLINQLKQVNSPDEAGQLMNRF